MIQSFHFRDKGSGPPVSTCKVGPCRFRGKSSSPGVSYGYSLPLTSRLNMDFTLGLGYLGGIYKEYLPIDDHYVWQKTRRMNWFGPTKAEISLVWLIGRGNKNAQKGGIR